MGRAKNSLLATVTGPDAFTAALGGRRGMDPQAAQQRQRIEEVQASTSPQPLLAALHDTDEAVARVAVQQLADALDRNELDEVTRTGLWLQLSSLAPDVQEPLHSALLQHVAAHGDLEDAGTALAYISAQGDEGQRAATAVSSLWGRLEAAQKAELAQKLTDAVQSGNTAMEPLVLKLIDEPESLVYQTLVNQAGESLRNGKSVLNLNRMFTQANPFPQGTQWVIGACAYDNDCQATETELEPVVARITDAAFTATLSDETKTGQRNLGWEMLRNALNLSVQQRGRLLTMLRREQPGNFDTRHWGNAAAFLDERDSNGELTPAARLALDCATAQPGLFARSVYLGDRSRAYLVNELAKMPATVQAQPDVQALREQLQQEAVAQGEATLNRALRELKLVETADGELVALNPDKDMATPASLPQAIAAYEQAFREQGQPESALAQVLRDEYITQAAAILSRYEQAAKNLFSMNYERLADDAKRLGVLPRNLSSALSEQKWQMVLRAGMVYSDSSDRKITGMCNLNGTDLREKYRELTGIKAKERNRF